MYNFICIATIHTHYQVESNRKMFRHAATLSVYLTYLRLHLTLTFANTPLLSSQLQEPPWVAWHVNENTNETSYEGFLIDLLVLLSSQLNFRYTLVYNDILGEPETRPNGTNVDDEVQRMLLEHEVQSTVMKKYSWLDPAFSGIWIIFCFDCFDHIQT